MSKYRKLELTLGKKYHISNWKNISYIIPIRYITSSPRGRYLHNNRACYAPPCYYSQVSYLNGRSEFLNIKTKDLRKFIKKLDKF